MKRGRRKWKGGLTHNNYLNSSFFKKWILASCPERNHGLPNTPYCLKITGNVNLKWQNREAHI